MLTFTDNDFDAEVLQSSQPVLVEFWATWCGPCRALEPVVESVAKQHAGRLKVGKLNIDEHPRAPTRFEVRSVPTLLLFAGGRVVGHLVGSVPRPKIEAMLESGLGAVALFQRG
jgi:thioredoxin 1